MDGIKSSCMLADELGCVKSVVLSWVSNYKTFGEKAFDDKPKNKSYPKELKLAAINDYLNGEGLLQDISSKYEIYNISTLFNWIMKYNSYKEIKDYNPKGDVYITKSRKTNYEEKIEIVNHCIENNRNYKLTAEYFNQPYSKVYQWVRKYDENGEIGLLDRRGQRKAESELSEEEKLKRELERIKRENMRLKMENDLLKKLEEIKRRDRLTGSDKKRNTKR